MVDFGIRAKIVVVDRFSPVVRIIGRKLMLWQFRVFLRRNKGNQAHFRSNHPLVTLP